MDLNNANQNAERLNETFNAIEQAIRNSTQASADLTDQTRSLTEELKDQLGIRSRQTEGDRALLQVSRDITKSAQENKVILGQQGSLAKQITIEEKQIEAAKREQSILSKTLSDEEIKRADKIAGAVKAQQAQLSKIDELKAQIGAQEGNATAEQLSRLAREEGILSNIENQVAKQLEGASNEAQRLALANQLIESAQENLAASEKEEATQQRINSAMGVAGNIIAGLSEVAGKFGKAFNLDKVAADMKKFTEEAQRAEDELAELEGREAQVISRTAALGVGLKSAFNNLGSFLTDPSVVFGAIMHGFNEVEKEQQNFRRLTGQNADAFRGINGSLTTTSQYLKGMVTLSKELGVNANVVFPPETVTTVTELVEQMGMAGAEAAKLAQLSQISGTNLKENAKQIEKGFKNFVQQNGVALNFGDIMSDVANVSAATSVSLGNNPKKIQDAALAAAKLGLSMAQVEKISESLLNFESSIQKEMEAELLTGTQLNLEKARELALAGDIAGVAEEIGKNQELNQAFAKGNVIQQKALAESLGMSREDMAQMILQQKIQSGLSTEQAAKAANISLDEAKRLTTQQQITESLQKMAQAVAPILSVISSLLSNSFVLYTTMATLAAVYINKLIPAVGKYVLTQVKSLNLTKLQNIASKALNVIKGATITLMNSEFMVKTKDFVLSKAKAAQDAIINGYMVVRNTLMNTAIGRYLALGAAKLVDTIRTWAGVGATVAQTTANAGLAASQTTLGTTGAAAGGGMAAAGAGLGAFGAAAAPAIPVILAIGAALLMASPAIYAFSFVIEALGNIIIGALQSLPPIITAIAEGFTMFLGAITFEKAAALPLVGLGLVSLAAGVMAMVVTLPFLPFAALGIWALSYALTPLIESIAEAGPGLEALSGSLISMTSTIPLLYGVAAGLGVLASAAASLGFASPLIIAGSFAISTLGLAMIPLSIGFERMAAANVEGLVTSLQGLAGVAPQLFGVAAGLGAISVGLAGIAGTGLLALPIIGALTALGTVSEGLSSIFGGGGTNEDKTATKDEGSMKAIEQKLDQLIAVVSEGGDVYIDGSKVGKTLQLASSKMG